MVSELNEFKAKFFTDLISFTAASKESDYSGEEDDSNDDANIGSFDEEEMEAEGMFRSVKFSFSNLFDSRYEAYSKASWRSCCGRASAKTSENGR